MAVVHKTNGEGSIIHDTAGGRDRWIYQYCIYDVHGKRKRHSITRRTKTELLQAVAAYKQTIQSSDAGKNNEIKCGELFDKWLEEIKHSVKPGTLRFYKTLLKLVTTKVRMKKLTSVEIHHIQEMLNYLQENGGKSGKGLSPKTIRSLRTTLKTCFEYAVDNGFVKSNVVKKSKPPRLIQRTIRFLDKKQVRILLEVAEKGEYLIDGYHAAGKKEIERIFVTKRNAMLIRLALSTGMRRGELFGLTWSDVDFDNCTINVHQALINRRISEVKTSNSVRRIKTDKTTMNKLKDWHLWLEKYCTELPMFRNKENLVFQNKYGHPIDVDNFSRRHFNKIVTYAGLPKNVTMHSLRHTVATLLLENGVPANVVSAQLGHASTSFTLSVYAHITNSMEQSAADMIGNLLDSSSETANSESGKEVK